MKGIVNLGNTCYFNVALQCLMHVPIIRNVKYEGDCMFTKIFFNFTQQFWDPNTGKIFNVQPLLDEFQKHFPRFKSLEQHDVQETILCIIDILEKSIPELKKYFYGKKVQETVWPGGSKKQEEDFSVHILCANGSSFKDMLLQSFAWNVLTDYEPYHVATTRCFFSKHPKVLMVSFDKKGRVNVNEKLTIDGYEYELVASAVHLGVQHDGHYVAFTKHVDKWYYKNDDFVSEQPFPCDAPHYLLMYILKSPPS
jgi:ubiquitin C-terminal hydrolase